MTSLGVPLSTEPRQGLIMLLHQSSLRDATNGVISTQRLKYVFFFIGFISSVIFRLI